MASHNFLRTMDLHLIPLDLVEWVEIQDTSSGTRLTVYHRSAFVPNPKIYQNIVDGDQSLSKMFTELVAGLAKECKKNV